MRVGSVMSAIGASRLFIAMIAATGRRAVMSGCQILANGAVMEVRPARWSLQAAKPQATPISRSTRPAGGVGGGGSTTAGGASQPMRCDAAFARVVAGMIGGQGVTPPVVEPQVDG